ncbi:protein yellow isoform X1 [Diachasma alloeum]|uniref:protein yellow isoform X1 n=1 Tax=Diachasma alloeum TaxID=454923 RepID=UPI0007382F93|nr:protein yellow isoform X1 [Diachasma alloeum]
MSSSFILQFHYPLSAAGMTNVMPLLVSMTLLGLQEYSAQSPNLLEQISQELEPPRIPEGGYRVSSSSFLSPEILNSMRSGRFSESQHSTSYGNTNGNDITFAEPSQSFEPPGNSIPKEDKPGPSMELVYAWSTVDFEFESEAARERAIFEGSYIPENNLPLGLEFWHDRVFVTLPKWRSGVPATLTTAPRFSKDKSPKLRPYPSWGWHHQDSCGGMTSVFRIQVDECDRLWVLDSGTVNLTADPRQICPPAIFIFDLRTDRLLRRYQIPEDQVKQDSLWSNIVVDVRDGDCTSAKVYLSDVWRFAMIVYDFSNDTSFRIQHHFFLPDPLSARYELHGIQFQWMDGILGLALSPLDINNDRTLFFHPMSSFREFAVATSVLNDKDTAETSPESFMPVGKPRAKDYGHSSGSAIDKHGVMFINMVTRDSVWCWDTRKEYIPQNLGVIGVSNESLVFPNDLRVDHEDRQSFWTISNRLPMYLYGPWNPHDINFRVYRAYVDEAVRNTVCDPDYIVPESENGYDETC